LKRLLSKAQAVDELESTIPSFVEKTMHKNYPAYVHVLRVSVHEAKTDDSCSSVPLLITVMLCALLVLCAVAFYYLRRCCWCMWYA
jgi:hypothetical protein